jgi:F420 biosynthesis protein FbiB-like protein
MTPQVDFHAIAAARQSVRDFSGQAVGRPVVERILQAACLAPSAHNRQPWRFVVVEDASRKTALAGAMTARLMRERAADGDAAEAIAADASRARRRLEGAPAVVVVCLTMEDMDRYPDERRQEAEWTMAAQSVAMAGENLLLAASAEGLGACWMCAPLFAPDEVRRSLSLPEAWEPQGMVLLGYPAAAAQRKARRPVGEVTRWV